MTQHSRNSDDSDRAIRFRLEARQVELVYDNGPKGMYVTLVNAFVLAYLFYPAIPLGTLVVWYASMAAIIGLRFGLIWAFNRKKPDIKRPGAWANIYMAGTFITGVVWGFSSLLFFFDLSVIQQTFQIMNIAGMVAAASAYQSSVYRCFAAYAVPAAGPLAVVLFMSSSDVAFLAMGGLTVLYIVMMLVIGHRTNVIIAETITKELKNMDLADSLRDSESKFRTLTESTASGIFIIQNGRFKYVNRAGEEITGYTLDELDGQNYLMIIHPDFRDIVRKRENAHLADENSIDVTTRYKFKFIRKDGSDRWVDFTAGVLMYAGEKSILGTAFDITERENARKALRVSERRYRMLFNSANDAIFVIETIKPGQPARFADVNEKACERLGYSREELLGMSPLGIECHESQDGSPKLSDICLPDGPGVFEGVHVAKDGKRIPVEISAHQFELDGRPIAVCIARDITERKTLLEELTRMATIDSLTGVFNRRQFFNRANEELVLALHGKRPLSLLMMDIDHFKNINDTYGHQVGDEALRTMVGVCKKYLRSNDVFGRLGGEEFAALLVGATRDTGMEIAERLRGALSKTEVCADGMSFEMTVSIGLTTMTPEDKGLDGMIRRSDQALYLAKSKGRNQVAEILQVEN